MHSQLTAASKGVALEATAEVAQRELEKRATQLSQQAQMLQQRLGAIGSSKGIESLASGHREDASSAPAERAHLFGMDQHSQLQAALLALETENASLREQLRLLQEEHTMQSLLVDDLRRSSETFLQLNGSANTHLSAKEEQCRQLEMRLSQALRELDTHRHMAQTASRELHRNALPAGEAEAEVHRLAEHNRLLGLEAEQLRAFVASLEAQIAVLEEKAVCFDEALEVHERGGSTSELQEQVATLRAWAVKCEAELKDSFVKVSEAEAESEHLRATELALREELHSSFRRHGEEATEAFHSHAEARAADAERPIETLRIECLDLKSRSNEMMASERHRELTGARISSELSAMKTRLGDATSQRSEMCMEVAKLRAQVVGHREASAESRRQHMLAATSASEARSEVAELRRHQFGREALLTREREACSKQLQASAKEVEALEERLSHALSDRDVALQELRGEHSTVKQERQVEEELHAAQNENLKALAWNRTLVDEGVFLRSRCRALEAALESHLGQSLASTIVADSNAAAAKTTVATADRADVAAYVAANIASSAAAAFAIASTPCTAGALPQSRSSTPRTVLEWTPSQATVLLKVEPSTPTLQRSTSSSMVPPSPRTQSPGPSLLSVARASPHAISTSVASSPTVVKGSFTSWPLGSSAAVPGGLFQSYPSLASLGDFCDSSASSAPTLREVYGTARTLTRTQSVSTPSMAPLRGSTPSRPRGASSREVIPLVVKQIVSPRIVVQQSSLASDTSCQTLDKKHSLSEQSRLSTLLGSLSSCASQNGAATVVAGSGSGVAAATAATITTTSAGSFSCDGSESSFVLRQQRAEATTASEGVRSQVAAVSSVPVVKVGRVVRRIRDGSSAVTGSSS